MNIGEILDRAISTYVRRFGPLFVLLAITTIPAGIMQALGEPQIRHFNDVLALLNRLPPSDVNGRNTLLFQALSAITPSTLLLLFVIPGLLSLLSRNALFVFANGIFDGVPPSIGAAYRASLPKWIPQIVAAFAFSVVAFAVVFAFLIIAVLVVVVIALVLRGAGNIAAGVGVFIVIVPVAGLTFIIMALLNVVWELTSIGVALEGTSPFRALGNGLRRTFDRALFGRTIGVALAYTVVEFAGTGALLAAISLVRAFVHLDVVSDILSALATMLIGGVLAIFMVVYARDLRVRREGLDLLLAANAAPAVP
jgi:hypothetical protein